MKNDPLVSIIIPCYNYGEFLAEAIGSALAQTYQPVEVLVVDDGSTDETSKVVESYASRGVHYEFKQNGGPSSARNFGSRHAAGEFVVFLDADDVLDPAFVTETMSALNNNPGAAYAYPQMQTFGRESATTNFPEFDVKRLATENFVCATSLLRRDCFAVAQYNERLKDWEDWDFYLQLATRGKYGVLVNKPLLRYRKHTSRSDRLNDPKEQRKLLVPLYLHYWRLHRPSFLFKFVIMHYLLLLRGK